MVVVIYRWSLQTGGHYKQEVVTDSWLLFRGGCQLSKPVYNYQSPYPKIVIVVCRKVFCCCSKVVVEFQLGPHSCGHGRQVVAIRKWFEYKFRILCVCFSMVFLRIVCIAFCIALIVVLLTKQINDQLKSEDCQSDKSNNFGIAQQMNRTNER